ncbi:MAG: hypothetical protein ABI378_03620 [Chitinophagaceae bacterium]
MRKLLLYALILLAIPAGAQKKHSTKQTAFDFGADHIITFTPIAGIVSYGNFNPGIGFDYEYIVSRKLGMGIHIPVMYGFNDVTYVDYYNNYSLKRTCFFTAPGIRFHTGKKGGKVDFATGPSVLIGNMNFRYKDDNGYHPSSAPSDYSYNMLGIVVDNSLNFTRNHFVFGFNVKVGTMADKHEDSHYFMQFGMQFGGKF